MTLSGEVERSVLTDLIKEINKSYGGAAIRFASDMPVMPRISTGIFSLDAFIGGGIPMGKVMLLYGPEHSGKTTIALKTVANAQRTDRETFEPLRDGKRPNGDRGVPMNVLYVDSEGRLNLEWMTTLGVDTGKMLLQEAVFQEQAYDTIFAALNTGEIDVIVVDSIAAMAPSTEMEASTEDWQMGLAARINNKFLRMLKGAMNKLSQQKQIPPIVILINQPREKIGGYGLSETLPGGKGQGYVADLRVRVSKVSKPVENAAKEMIGIQSNFSINKNTITGLLENGSYSIYVRDHPPIKKGDTDEHQQVVDFAKRVGVIDQRGAYYFLPGEEKGIQGLKGVLEYFEAEPEKYEDIRNAVIHIVTKGQEQV